MKELAKKVEALKTEAANLLGEKFQAKLAKHETEANNWGKPGSKKYLEILKGSLENDIERAGYETVFIPPSPETLEWGGFLGGETVNVRRAA